MALSSIFTFPEAGVRVTAGALVLAASLGVAGSAMAGPYRHHRPAAHEDFNALVAPAPELSGSWTGSWRYRMFHRGGCDRSYPMHEGSPCGSTTGGPVGGMGS